MIYCDDQIILGVYIHVLYSKEKADRAWESQSVLQTKFKLG